MSFTVYLDHENGSRSEFYRSHFGQPSAYLFLYAGQYTVLSTTNNCTQTVYDNGYYTITAAGIDLSGAVAASYATTTQINTPVSPSYYTATSSTYAIPNPPSEYEQMYNELLIKYNNVVEENKALVNSLFENT